jgi:TIR domain
MPAEATESGQRQTPAGAPSLPNPPHASIDIFVSYASPDAPAANSVVATLEKHGLKCWIAPRDVIPGRTMRTASCPRSTRQRSWS